MSKTKEAVIKQPNTNAWLGAWSMLLAFAEIITVYTFATQNNEILWVIAGLIGIDALIRFASAFIFNKKYATN
jgi:hypothetical protein